MKFYEEKGLAVCGLACVLCSVESCPGCSKRGCTNVDNCSVYQCASNKGLTACYLCSEFPCGQKSFQNPRLRAFNCYAKEHGIEKLMAKLRANFEDGITYHRSDGLKGDYDNFTDEGQIVSLIEYGRSMNPYERCPVFETEHFILRLVQESDAEDLLACYSDPDAQRFFNSDNCTSDFSYATKEEMQECIRFWLRSYQARYFVRWSVIDKQSKGAIGTIEMFGDPQGWGVLRVDLAASYETEALLDELFSLASKHFFKLFKVDKMLTKAIPAATARIAALQKNSFDPAEVPGREHYYLLSR
ncbi:MAG: GNAT family N-acetyltransferase [Bacillota bacterium]